MGFEVGIQIAQVGPLNLRWPQLGPKVGIMYVLWIPLDLFAAHACLVCRTQKAHSNYTQVFKFKVHQQPGLEILNFGLGILSFGTQAFLEVQGIWSPRHPLLWSRGRAVPPSPALWPPKWPPWPSAPAACRRPYGKQSLQRWVCVYNHVCMYMEKRNIGTHMHACMPACMHTYVRTFVRT